jgi:Cdc6-like AAA superfamily ATPase
MRGTKIYYEAEGDFDVIDFAQQFNINYCRGAIIKYLVRAGKKENNPEVQDLRKAMDYLEREIEFAERKQRKYINENTD